MRFAKDSCAAASCHSSAPGFSLAFALPLLLDRSGSEIEMLWRVPSLVQTSTGLSGNVSLQDELNGPGFGLWLWERKAR